MGKKADSKKFFALCLSGDTGRRGYDHDTLAEAQHSVDVLKRGHVYVRIDIVTNLMKAIGAEAGTCSRCNAPIWWVRTKAGKKAPYNLGGLNHFADCPDAQKFRREQ